MTNPKSTYLRVAFGFLLIAASAVILPIVFTGLGIFAIPVGLAAIIGAAFSALFSLTVPKG